jgi:hypothetical protein
VCIAFSNWDTESDAKGSVEQDEKKYKSYEKLAFGFRRCRIQSTYVLLAKTRVLLHNQTHQHYPFMRQQQKGVPQQSGFMFPNHCARTNTYLNPTNYHSKSKKRKRGAGGEQNGETANLHMLLLRVVVTTNGDRTERMEEVWFKRNPYIV